MTIEREVWRTLKEALPAEWQHVLAYDSARDGPGYGIAFWYNHSGGGICWSWNGVTGSGISAPEVWMPLPLAPGDEEEWHGA